MRPFPCRLAALLARRPRLAALATLALLACAAGPRDAGAAEASLRGGEMNGFGRIALQFDKATKVSARVANGILMVSFPEPVTIREERLVAELPSYVSIARRDPDGTGMRIALTRTFRPNLLEAGERVFIDLLPENWTGLPPGLPQEVVTELARRAREAESKVREETHRRQTEAPKPVTVRVAQLPTLTRAVFVPPKLAAISLKADGGDVELFFDAPMTLEAGKLRAQLGSAVRAITAHPGPGSLTVKLTLDQGYEARGFREDETFVLDLVKPKQAGPAPVGAAILTAEKGAGEPDPAPPAPARPSAPPRVSANAAPVAPPPPVSTSPVRPEVAASPDELRLVFPFAARTAAAAFERGGLVTVQLPKGQPVEAPGLPPDALRHATKMETARDGALAIVRLTLAEPHLIRLAPEDDRWVLTVGDKGAGASEALRVSRKADGAGRNSVTVALAEPSGLHWTRDAHSGERLAVATGFGPSRGLSKPQAFVEFRLLQSAHGVVAAAEADDLTALANPEGVTISRPSGLTVSTSSLLSDAEPGARDRDQLLVNRDEWQSWRLGDVGERSRKLMQTIVEAKGPALGQARLSLARVLMAAGLNVEASGILAIATEQDPALQRQGKVVLLRGVVAARMGRIAEARKLLSPETLPDDEEAVLWRAVLDGKDKRWREALVGFRRSNLVLDLYPDDLQGPMRLLAARAAIETQEHGYAENELVALGQLPAGSYSAQEAALLRARLDEAAGRTAAAADLYRRISAEAERPVAAEAAARWIALGLRDGSLTREDAIPRLETLAVIWRGGDIEIATIGQLGRLYAEAGRWREAFVIAARANALFPDHEISRTLHEETGRLFDELFLTGKGETLSRIDALALYFDFKQFTPIGRRGDEIVRRLADRLVELDLLEQAGELLQHQVDNRLTGAARATVAARLATIRLIDNKPALALSTLHATRLPELPAPIKRARLLLEARALSDLSRTEFAIDVLRDETGPEIDRLRADIYWTGRRWREAGEAHESLVGTRWQGPEPLSDRDRLDVLRAAVAYSLGEERLALDRLRGKFAARMADSADARTFAFLIRPNIANTRPFREIARTVTSADTLADFLSEYRKRYPDAAAAERRRPRPDAPPAQEPARPQAQSAGDRPASPNG